ncbi:hypothetical protein R1sor_008945 [Riccia sorocarpa]|uniref:Uncharacterized protein n=1 Tax=Riccia sorocarpa TaxID=122646 RepID=A0ABD3H6E7_9MARC
MPDELTLFPFPYAYWSRKDVQEPPAGPFKSEQLLWFCEEAVIPASRVVDFLEEESNCPQTSCKYTRRKVDDPEMVTGEKKSGSRDLSHKFMEEFKDEIKFMEYYATHWHVRLEKWAKESRCFRHNNQNTNGSIERWHRTLKVHLRASRKGKTNRRIKCLLLSGFTELEIVQHLGTYSGTFAGGLKLLTTPVPDEDFEDHVINIDAPQSPTPAEAENTVLQDKPPYTEEDAVKLMHRNVADLAARDSLLQLDQHAEPFQILPRTDNSLKQRPDFVKRFMGKGHSKASNSSHIKQAAVLEISVEDFSQKRVQLPSMQSVLDKAALQSINLNLPPDQYQLDRQVK